MAEIYEVNGSYFFEIKMPEPCIIDAFRDAIERYGEVLAPMVPVITANISSFDTGCVYSLYMTIEGMEENRQFFSGYLTGKWEDAGKLKEEILQVIDANLQSEEWYAVLADWYSIAGVAYERPTL